MEDPNQATCALPETKYQLLSNKVQRTLQESSIRVFRRFIVTKVMDDGSVDYDASQIVSKKCYDAWLASRGVTPKLPEKIFQRSLTGHITSSDTRQPFRPLEEAAILAVLRAKRVWLVFLLLVLEF